MRSIPSPFYTTSSSYFDHAPPKRKPQDKPAANVSDKGLDGAKKKRDEEIDVENTPFRVILLVVERERRFQRKRKKENVRRTKQEKPTLYYGNVHTLTYDAYIYIYIYKAGEEYRHTYIYIYTHVYWFSSLLA